MCRQVTEIGDSHHFLAYLSRQLQYFLMRTRQKIFQNAQLVHEFKRGRMNGVSAEIAQKIRMLFEHTYIHACPGQKKAKHHAGWSSSGDAATSVNGFSHSKDVTIIVEIRGRGRQTNHFPIPRDLGKLSYPLPIHPKSSHVIGNNILDSCEQTCYSFFMTSEIKEPKTLQEAITYFSDIDNCLAYLAKKRWPDGVVICPTCGGKEVHFLKTRRLWQCVNEHPRRQFSIKVGTIMEDSAIGLDKWLSAMWMISNDKNGISSYELHRC